LRFAQFSRFSLPRELNLVEFRPIIQNGAAAVSELDDPFIYRSVLESLQIGIFMVDRDQKIVFWNEGAEKITGYLRQDVLGRYCREDSTEKDSSHNNVASDASELLTTALRDGRPAMGEVPLRHKSGHRIFVRARAVPIRNASGTIIGAAQSIDESISASEWDRRQSKLADYGCPDSATGVLTHDVIISHLREAVATYAEAHVPFSILVAKVDDTDRLRSTYGGAVIASVLRVAASSMENSLRPTDYLGRISESRFLAILNECGSTELPKTAERIKKTVNGSEIQWWGDRWTVTVSVGGATVVAGDTLDSLLARGSDALERSVEAGGNRVMIGAPASDGQPAH
jgi:PAS domain S-box-containing protein/diguanylate cyclase (GGDEF)-like protein